MTSVNIILGDFFYFGNYNCLEYRGISNFHYPNNNDYFYSLDFNNHEGNLFSLIYSGLLRCNVIHEIIVKKSFSNFSS